MANAVSYLGSICSGHGCFPPRVNTGGSGNVFVNGHPVHRVGDGWSTHSCGNNSHAGSLAAGSLSVFCNGNAVGRIGDAVNCGSVVSIGSPNVFCG